MKPIDNTQEGDLAISKQYLHVLCTYSWLFNRSRYCSLFPPSHDYIVTPDLCHLGVGVFLALGHGLLEA